MLRSLIELVAGLPPPLLVALAVGLAFGETAIMLDLVVPGEAGIVVIGAAGAAAGVPVWLLAAGAVLGSAAGDSVSFAIGRRLGPAAEHRWSDRRAMKHAITSARDLFERHGGVTVFVGRWIGALRAVVPFVAGGAGMRLRTFLAWNVAASMTWATAMIAIGHRYGMSVADALDRVERGMTIAIVALALGVVVVVRHRSRSTAPDG